MMTKLDFLVSVVSFIFAGWFSLEERTAVTIFLLFNTVLFFLIGILNIFIKEDSKDEHRN